MSRFDSGFSPYVPVAQRRRNAEKEASKLQKKGTVLEPVGAQGRAIAKSFWGAAWCTNLESYSDFANRLPRGRTYLRNGSVIHLSIQPGRIEALVSGSSIYKIAITIKPCPPAKWLALCERCAGEIGSMIDLLQGKLSRRVMEVMTQRETGLFPSPAEITLGCSCPDWADMCKHVAAVLYGVGARLDEKPELLFTLRSVDHTALIAHAAAATQFSEAAAAPGEGELADADVSALFGIEIEQAGSGPQSPAAASPVAATTATAGRTPALKARKPAAAAKPSTAAKTTGAKPAAAKPSQSKAPVAKPAAPKPASTKSARATLRDAKPFTSKPVHATLAPSKLTAAKPVASKKAVRIPTKKPSLPRPPAARYPIN
jgi:uncharacterized Zn finger protein